MRSWSDTDIDSQILYFRVAEMREAEEATFQKSFSVLDTPFAVAHRRVKRKPAKRYNSGITQHRQDARKLENVTLPLATPLIQLYLCRQYLR